MHTSKTVIHASKKRRIGDHEQPKHWGKLFKSVTYIDLRLELPCLRGDLQQLGLGPPQLLPLLLARLSQLRREGLEL